MKRLLLITAVLLPSLAAGLAEQARTGERVRRGTVVYDQGPGASWHGYYYDPAWGMPVALVVPPRVKSQTNWGWGVGNTRVTSIPYQFEPGEPGPGVYDRRMYQPTPAWPTDTTQFGHYYIRGPW
jgi:hypothetical protein